MQKRLRFLYNRIKFAGPVLKQLLRWMFLGRGEGYIYFGKTASSAGSREDEKTGWLIAYRGTHDLIPKTVGESVAFSTEGEENHG